jgi:hypothetical protein
VHKADTEDEDDDDDDDDNDNNNNNVLRYSHIRNYARE